MLFATNEVNNLTPRRRKKSVLSKRSGHIIKANYTKHLYIDHSPTHMPLNKKIMPYKRANHSQTRRGRNDLDATSLFAE